MKTWILILIGFVFPLQSIFPKTQLPAEIAKAIAKNSYNLPKDGAMSVWDERFISYICGNWRWILDDFENLPKTEGSFSPREAAFRASFMTVARACEELPPIEYVDFLDQVLILHERKRIPYEIFEDVLFTQGRKHYFPQVNWKHPRMKAILAKAKKLAPPENESLSSYLDEVARGKLADNYLTNMSDDWRPETLPGIKLPYPYQSILIKVGLVIFGIVSLILFGIVHECRAFMRRRNRLSRLRQPKERGLQSAPENPV